MTEAESKRTGRGRLVLGVILLSLGVLLLISKAGVFDVDFNRLVGFMVVVAGGFMAIDNFAKSDQNRLFWGVVLFLSGLLILLVSYSFVPESWDKIWPSVLIIPGLAFLMLFFSRPEEIMVLVVAAAFVVTGGAGLLVGRFNFDLEGYLSDPFRVAVPVAIVLAGFYVIWKNLSRNRA